MKKSKKSKIPVTLILFFIMLLTFLWSMLSQARYRTIVNSNFNTNIAKWTFKFKDNNQEIFSINLANTKLVSDKNTYINNETIMPGEQGIIPIELDFTETQVDIEYELILTEESNKEFPPNVKINVSKEDGSVVDLRSGTYIESKELSQIKENPIELITIRWEWNIDEKIDESEYEGKDMNINISIVGKQKY